MAKGYELNDLEAWTQFGTGSYKSLDPKESPHLARQLITTQVDASNLEELAFITNRSLKISAQTMALEEHLFPKAKTQPKTTKPVATYVPPTLTSEPTPHASERNTQVSPDLKMRVLAKLSELKLEHKTRTVPVLQQAAQAIQAAPETVHVIPTHRYSVFRLGSRRYAIPADNLIHVGRVTARDWMSKFVKTETSMVPLLDLKRVLQIDGEAGQIYLLMKINGRFQAWAVDGLEGTQQFQKEEIRDLPRIGTGLPNPWVTGLRRGGAWDGPPITVLNASRIFQVLSKRAHV